MALELIKLVKGGSPVAQSGNFGFFKLGVESGGGEDVPMVYGIKIDLANSNPETSVTYTDDASSFTKSYMDFENDTFVWGSWQDKFPFNKIKPCYMENGVVTKYLNPNNYAEDVDGNAVDITSTGAGDVMIEIPKIYYRLHKDSSYQYIQISNAMFEGACCLAHTYKGVEKDKVYIGAYESYYDGTSSRSVSGVSATGSVSLNGWRTYAQNNGKGYETFYWNLLVLIQCLYAIQFKNLNSQTALGYGWCGYTSGHPAGGGLNQKGLYYGTSKSGQMKFMGIEDFYGNREDWIDGAYINGTSLTVADATSPNMAFSGNGVGYITAATELNTSSEKYYNSIVGDNNSGFCPKSFYGSATKYYCDYGATKSSSVLSFGGGQGSTTLAGIFSMYFAYSGDTSSEPRSSRLAFCG